jgi:hypothetical protein
MLRKHPDFETRRRAVERIGVLPPQVEMDPVGASRSDVSKRVSEELIASVERVLEKRGFEVVAPGQLVASGQEPTRAARAALDSALMWPDPLPMEAARAFRATLEPGMLPPLNQPGADALILISLRTPAAAMSPESGGDAEACSLRLAIIDAHNGDILWANLTSSSSPIPSSYSRKAVRRLVDEAMDPLSCAYRSASSQTGKVCHHVPAAFRSGRRNVPVSLRGASR